MTIDQEQFQLREAEQGRGDERNEQWERFVGPSVLPSPKTLWAQVLERFEVSKSITSGGYMLIVDRQTGERAKYLDSFWGGVSATCWMVERMGETEKAA